MIEELNCKFALQLDPDPMTDRYSQEASGLHDHSDMLNVVFAGGSHSSRMLDQISDPNLKLLDCTVPGFRITEQSVADMAKEIKGIASFLTTASTTDPGKRARCSCPRRAQTASIMLKAH
jgi:hypothetical protein